MRVTALPTMAVVLIVTLAGCTARQAGMRAAASGDEQTAVRFLKEVVANDPTDAVARRELAQAYLRLADAGLAEGYLDQATRLAGDDRVAFRRLACTREQLGWQIKSSETWNEIIRRFPDDRLAGLFRTHLGRLGQEMSALTQEAGRNRIDALREKGLLDERNLPRPVLVLPFDGPEPYPEYARLARALSRMIATDLSRLDILWVIGPDDAVRGMRLRGLAQDPNDLPGSLKQIGKAFGAGVVIGGSLLRGFDDQVRADVILAIPDPFAKLLDAKIVGTKSDFLLFEREVLDKLAGTLGLLPTDSEHSRFGRFHTANVTSLSAYLDGVAALLQHQFTSALSLLEEAAESDPEFPCPFRALAVIYRMQGRLERSKAASRKGQGRGNPRCAMDLSVLSFQIDLDNVEADLLARDLEQSRTALRNGVQLLFAGQEDPTDRFLREGFSGQPGSGPSVLPSGYIWGADQAGIPGTADRNTRGDGSSMGISPTDPATAGTEK